ncbi:hypothetical protein MHYP_G00306700 [Metynnis hypsauchen]
MIFCIWYDVPHLNQVCCSSPSGQAYCFSTGPGVMFFTYTKEKVLTYAWCMFPTWTSLLRACRGALGSQRGLHNVSSSWCGEKVSSEHPRSRDGSGEKGRSEPPRSRDGKGKVACSKHPWSRERREKKGSSPPGSCYASRLLTI